MTRAPKRDRAPLRFAWYGRLSTDELQQPQLAFPSQRAACEKRIDGLGRIVCEFTDVQSGRRDDRAGIEELLEEAGKPDRRFDAVVSYKAERFARRMALALAYEEELLRAGVPVYVSDEAGEPGRPTSVLTRRIKQAVGEWYVLELVEESRRGMEENTRQGFNTGGIAPYGYRKRYLPHPSKTMAERGHRKVLLQPDPEAASIVERIFREFVHGGLGIRGIAAMLNEEGIPSPRGGPWTGSAVSGILDNPKYTGYQVWNRRRRKTGGNRRNDEAEWVWSEAPAHEPIVSLDLWRAAQALRRRTDTDWRRRPHPGRAARPLRGLVLCGPCGHRMGAVHRTRSTVPVRWYWECPACKQRMRDDRLQAEVVGVLERELLHPDRLAALERHQESLLRKARKESLKSRTSLESRMASLRAEQHAQVRSVAAGIDPLLVKEVVEELQQEEREIRVRLRKLDSPENVAPTLTAIRRLREHADDLRQVLVAGDSDDQRKIFTRTIRSVTWMREEDRLELRLTLPQPEPEEARVETVRARGGIRTHTSRRTSALKADASAFRHPGATDCRAPRPDDDRHSD
jgi:site-specific DNA recombinase